MGIKRCLVALSQLGSVIHLDDETNLVEAKRKMTSEKEVKRGNKNYMEEADDEDYQVLRQPTQKDALLDLLLVDEWILSAKGKLVVVLATVTMRPPTVSETSSRRDERNDIGHTGHPVSSGSGSQIALDIHVPASVRSLVWFAMGSLAISLTTQAKE
ncbi:hypothetical protein BTVI_69691 [Pitangus sulphuratus]|nr:hypothetical protein BTVI_69691 [Pitangus sulphuratus]